ncbi:unnamed protein product [Clavelina lepadiformis]|uniref:C-type lectin domain-containing protein n=1 Tax=Clavelina lepadiformis TaxID=159417 RepID=A0ABP0FEQ3_CLALP
MGADLAAVGMRNLSVRRNLATALFRTSTLTWIGLSDLEYDGQWVWVDEVPATEETAAWLPGEPNDGRYSRCAHINYKTPKYQANDVPCSGRRYNALCEKPINDLC